MNGLTKPDHPLIDHASIVEGIWNAATRGRTPEETARLLGVPLEVVRWHRAVFFRQHPTLVDPWAEPSSSPLMAAPAPHSPDVSPFESVRDGHERKIRNHLDGMGLDLSGGVLPHGAVNDLKRRCLESGMGEDTFKENWPNVKRSLGLLSNRDARRRGRTG